MALSNQERVGEAMELLRTGLARSPNRAYSRWEPSGNEVRDAV